MVTYDYAAQQRKPGRHLVGIGMVILMHILLGWALVTGLARRQGVQLLPIDSEHAALHQALRCGGPKEARRLVLRALKEGKVQGLDVLWPQRWASLRAHAVHLELEP